LDDDEKEKPHGIGIAVGHRDGTEIIEGGFFDGQPNTHRWIFDIGTMY